MKRTILLIVICSFTLFGCNQSSEREAALPSIDLNQAFDLSRNVRLSDLVQSVEIVQFYPAEETFFVNARSFAVGQKYIMIADDGGGGTNNILLCKRNGEFIRTIGRTGKGPGEFLNAWVTLMDPSESYIVIVDYHSNKLIKYSVTGEFLKEHKMTELPGRNIIAGGRFINDNEFVIVPRRPVKGIEGFASLVVYDSEFNPSGKILPRANDKFLPLFNNSYQVIGSGPDRVFYWEPYFDTVYTINPDHSMEAKQVIGWSKNGPSFDYMSSFTYNLPPDKQYPINFITGITETDSYLFISGISGNNHFSAAYHKETEDLFLLSNTPGCGDESSIKSMSIENDLFGIEPVYIHTYEQGAGSYVIWLRPGMISSEYDLACLRGKEVKLPEVRDQLLKIIESEDPDNNLVLLIMEPRK